MGINADKPHRWKEDVQASVQLYNNWFLEAAPKAYRTQRSLVTNVVTRTLDVTSDFRNVTPKVIKAHPEILPVLRMATAPPIARDRLMGLSDTPAALQKTLEQGALPPRMRGSELDIHLVKMAAVLNDLLDVDLFPWLGAGSETDPRDRDMAAVVVADRLTGAQADPIVRNAQEFRQLALIEQWLLARGYTKKPHPSTSPLNRMAPGTFSFRMNVVVAAANGRQVNIPIDAVVQPKNPASHGYPLLIEAKSAGDFTNTNKRRKEEAQKVHQLRETYGKNVSLLLFLCGYFDTGYLGYEAAEGIDWVWEHRIDDLQEAIQ